MTSQPFVEQQTVSYHLIFNPVSGPGEPGEKLVEIERSLESLQSLTVRLTKEGMDITELARQAVNEGADVVIAAGGDGTISAVASALVDTDVTLGVIPTGTANGFASALNIPENIFDACQIIKAGHRQKVDTARCNGQLMLLVACIGFEAQLLTRMEREEKSRLGKFAIVVNSLKQLEEINQFEADLQTPEHEWQERATAVTIANNATVDMVLAQGPATTKPDDGELSITLVTPEHALGIVKTAANLFMSALRERSVDNESVHSWKAQRVTVTTEPPQTIFVDGEPCGETPLTVECFPKSLFVLTP